MGEAQEKPSGSIPPRRHHRIDQPERRAGDHHRGDRVTLVEIPHAGHALIVEQPDAVGRAIVTWLQEQAS